MNKITYQDIQLMVEAYQDNKIGDSEILQVFNILTKEVVDSFIDKYEKIKANNKLHCKTEKQKTAIIKHISNVCLDKIGRYDREKGKAYNYLTTIILCCIRQEYRSQLNYEKLRKEFNKKINHLPN